ncbi:MAG: GIY-YIG nuclease family protein [Sulfuricurvum sp.]
MYHYVYRITNTTLKKHYYGKRSSKLLPSLDLGIKYFSSSTDKEFKQDQKENPQNYKYKTVKTFYNSIEAVAFEIMLHNKFDVAKNIAFYNKAKQTAIGFDCTGNLLSNETKDKIRLGSIGRVMSKETKDKLRLINVGRKHSEATKQLLRDSQNKRVQSAEMRERIRKTKLGTTLTLSHKSKIAKGMIGKNIENRKKFVNIYNYITDNLIIANVCITDWCRLHPEYSQGTLVQTTHADRTKPSSAGNRLHHKKIYAQYIKYEKEQI